jgi:hypothetical protein
VKITIEMSRQNYDSLLSRVTEGSRAYVTLMSSVVYRESESLLPTDTVMTVCEDNEARALLELAQDCCPEAVSAIEAAVKNPRSA